MIKSYALIGAAGYVAPRHLRAIKETGGVLKAAVDRSDSVGVIDSYFPDAHFFTEFERFDRHIDLMRRKGHKIDYVSICSPNYLHDAHVRFALRSRADAICEKPLVLNPWNIGGLEELERETGQNVFTILQLRLHPSIIALKEKIAGEPKSKLHDVKLTYITSRGRWYFASWKGDEAKSGGIATNIGVHFYDMLSFVFGDLRENIVYHRAIDCAAGYLEYDRARVHWFLSINSRDLPEAVATSRKTYRSITIDGEEIEFSDGFTDLHIASYQKVLNGRGFRLADVRPSIETVAAIRTKDVDKAFDQVHPFIAKLERDQHRYEHGWPV
ncbi:Gfo/Idh/MocA family protein [Methylocystis silviterrae]|uniref:Gfo/Idh/MocA family protein n=1 Tax=Methylocystis silviterrae TaxID=2743612 RepID=UPI001AEDA50A|nr:Gfo/Idh/MocA family oxidoreductase [Methylocystis silviterrae]